jgi:TRAP-type C4-dicarboxylate transport system permease small subunit
MYSVYLKIQKCIENIFTFIVYVCCLALPILLFSQVIFRYIYKKPLNSLEEIATAAFMWMVIFGSGVLYKNKKHIIVDVFLDLFPSGLRKVLLLLTDIAVAIILVYLIKSCVMAIPFQKLYKTVILGIPKSAHTIAFCISLIYMFVCCIESIIKRILRMG